MTTAISTMRGQLYPLKKVLILFLLICSNTPPPPNSLPVPSSESVPAMSRFLGASRQTPVYYSSQTWGVQSSFLSSWPVGYSLLISSPPQEKGPVITLALKCTMAPIPILKWRWSQWWILFRSMGISNASLTCIATHSCWCIPMGTQSRRPRMPRSW